ncbi:deoxyribose-phosphate aldolase [Desulfallas thermosapovorans]|uniref:Deoxyribose-phosphate aldolase n=1 Tax=Desulfallas thermosapovorans DSM 6562 TaxID=1121431 RepID=A0A5S4ZMX4_9FIRM|nr:deoxyribose-phosphate aldolase [Desulfallas thermosapovorans]TYO93286.1 deoxyribose-phosphate aldolase [Desulfallas thermosapovorans DSM 6562]
MEITKNKLAGMIDHTLLKPAATREDIIALCAQAREYNFAAVCINPFWVPLACEQLVGSGVAVCTVIGFPLGATSTAAKAAEAGRAVRDGAGEVDVVINIGALKERCEDIVLGDIRAVVEAARGQNPDAITKVIIETCYLNREEKILACRLAARAGAQFVKTSTGFGTGGATEEDVALLRATVGPDMGVKASGGIKTAGQVLAMLKAGASRIGASAGVDIMKEWKESACCFTK